MANLDEFPADLSFSLYVPPQGLEFEWHTVQALSQAVASTGSASPLPSFMGLSSAGHPSQRFRVG